MSRISSLLACCGRGPLIALGIAAGVAFSLGFLAAGHGVGNGRVITVQEGGNGQEGMGEMDPEAMMQMMAQLNAPGEEHKELAFMVGSWDTKMEALSEAMAAFNGAGSATFEPVMGGRFIKQDYKGTMMGEAFTGVGLSGFNKASKKYEGVWYDSMGTALISVVGDKTDTGWVYEGKETDPMSGESFDFRHVITKQGDNAWTFSMQYHPEVAATMGIEAEDGATWVDCFRITYTRKGGGGGAGGGAGMNQNQGGNQNRGR